MKLTPEERQLAPWVAMHIETATGREIRTRYNWMPVVGYGLMTFAALSVVALVLRNV